MKMCSHRVAIFILSLLVCASAVLGEAEILNAEDFKKAVAAGPVFVKFFAPWCGHCQRLAPTWDELAEAFSGSSVRVAKVDCTQETPLCSEEGVRGYPTLKLFIGTHPVLYSGQRDLSSLKTFVLQHVEVVEGNEIGLVELSDENFMGFLEKSGIQFVKFYAPWCGHCQRLAPVWDELATYYKSDSSVHVGKVDCTRFGDLCSRYGVKGYPTLLTFGGGIALDKYDGERTLSSLIAFVSKQSGHDDDKVANTASEDQKKNKGHPLSPLVLTADNFDSSISEGISFIKFYAPWCGHCKRLAPTWDQLAEMAHETTHATIAKVDCTAETSLCSRFEITGYPTLILFSDGIKKTEYNKARDLDSLLSFLHENE
ncbi:PREDICTED: thioredoxin domain-containing protein 5-like [Amphimedon queenslandica]|uniref:Thioredoxin domain-containing protein n=1 Tax=Amphimedon queenslandica TaxID=400682 RepID=A0A1X7VCJ2_AMPQE|nr:PREDICTED: thioredoxin domain-containing protein 5-like [Amphimedon queenslandica]|eukprot:XP_003384827.2 PREDICTED: thioredoxin domain-containing protein 5-like [Amphimedon queenslandica]